MIRDIEFNHGVRVLLCVESGSRAWGFASADSDWDPRFIYAHPRPWYVSCRDRDEQITAGDDDLRIDMVGWDLRKALRLMAKGNPQLMEWLQSDLIYGQIGTCAGQLRDLGRCWWSRRQAIFHYVSMARGNYQKYLPPGRETVSLKRYLYVVRPLLACRWIRLADGLPSWVPPLDIDTLLDGPDRSRATMDHDAMNCIAWLLGAKRGGRELDEKPRLGALDRFIEVEVEISMSFAGGCAADRPSPGGRDALDRFLWDVAEEYT